MTDQNFPPPGEQPQYGAPGNPPQYGAPGGQPQYGAPANQPQYGAPANQPQYGAPGGQPPYGAPYGQPVYGSDQQQGGYYAPAPVTRPPTMDKAVMLMRAGAGMAILSALVDVMMQSEIDKSLQQFMVNLGLSADQTSQSGGTSAGSTIIGALIAAGLWWWMSVKNGQGKSWARVLSTIFFGIFTLSMLGNVLMPMPALVKVVTVVYWLVALGATWFMWQRESSNYYEAASRR